MKRHSRGFAYVEVLVAAVILVIALIPANQAFRTASTQAEYSRSLLTHHYRAFASLEVTQARTFTQLSAEATSTGGTTPASWSDPQGTANRRLIYVANIDFDNADKDNNLSTGIDSNIVRINVQVEGTPISFFAIVNNRK